MSLEVMFEEPSQSSSFFLLFSGGATVSTLVCVFCSLTQHTETRFYTVADRCMQNNNKNNLGENWVATAPPLPQTFTPNPELVRLATESKTGSVRGFVDGFID